MVDDSASRLARMKRLKDRVESRWRKQDGLRPTPLGHGVIDAALGGGLARGRLHELHALLPEDAPGAAGFAAMLAAQRGGVVIWVRPGRAGLSGQPYALGLRDIGLDPARLLLCIAPDTAGILQIANEAARCPQAATVIAEFWRRAPEFSLSASRRLALSAETSGATLLMLRIGAEPEPSAATTRWSVASAPSMPLLANAPGHIALDLALLRQRGGAGEGKWRVVWDREHGRFIDVPPLSGAGRPPAVLRPAGLARDAA